MADKTFTAGTVIDSAWLNDVNRLTYDLPLTASGKGASLVGFKSSETGAVDRTANDRLDSEVYVDDFRTAVATDDTAAFENAVAALSTVGGKIKFTQGKQYTISGTVHVNGSFGYRSILIDGCGAEIISTHAGAAILFTPSGPPASPQLKQRSQIQNLTFVGPGKTTAGSVGIQINYGASVKVSTCKFRNYEKGIYGLGALILRFFEVELYNNSWGFYFEPSTTPPFAPNDIHFNSCFIFENVRAGYATGFPNGVITFNECEIEGNNITGNAADGIAVLEFDKAGIVNVIGSHLEANYGQWHILFSGNANQSALNIVGGEMIPGNNNTAVIEMNTSYGSFGHLHVVGARITNTTTNQILLGTGAKATIIGETTGGIQGDLSNCLVIRNGRIATGVSATPANAGIRSKGSGGIAHDFEGQCRLVDSANTRLGYFQATAGGTFALVHDVDNQGIQFNTKVSAVSAPRFYIGRVGALSVEPGADNTYTLGSAALRWNTVYAGTGTINTSDARAKQQIATLSEKERSVALRCKALLRSYRFNDAVAEKGDGARIHFGVIAQDVVSAFKDAGLDAERYAIVCRDVTTAEDGTVSDRYGIRYDELFAFILGAL